VVFEALAVFGTGGAMMGMDNMIVDDASMLLWLLLLALPLLLLLTWIFEEEEVLMLLLLLLFELAIPVHVPVPASVFVTVEVAVVVGIVAFEKQELIAATAAAVDNAAEDGLSCSLEAEIPTGLDRMEMLALLLFLFVLVFALE